MLFSNTVFYPQLRRHCSLQWQDADHHCICNKIPPFFSINIGYVKSTQSDSEVMPKCTVCYRHISYGTSRFPIRYHIAIIIRPLASYHLTSRKRFVKTIGYLMKKKEIRLRFTVSLELWNYFERSFKRTSNLWFSIHVFIPQSK